MMADRIVKVKLVVNGEEKTLSVTGGEVLTDALRKSGYASVKRGCGTGDCGSCTVLLDGEPVRSCMVPAAQLAGRRVETVEGLSAGGQLHPVQQAFVDHAAMQCGFCTSGMVLATTALLEQKPSATEEEIRHFLRGNICRCTGYVKILEAVKSLV